MSSVFDYAAAVGEASQIREARVLLVTEGAEVRVRLEQTSEVLECQVLHTAPTGPSLEQDDKVLVWVRDSCASDGVVLGRIGAYPEPMQKVVPSKEFAQRPPTQLIEAQGDIVLRNGQARIKLAANGDLEILCSSFTTRSQRLLRLLAPLIKLN